MSTCMCVYATIETKYWSKEEKALKENHKKVIRFADNEGNEESDKLL